MSRSSHFFCPLLVAFALWVVLAIAQAGGQRTLFSSSGTDPFSDFWMPRTTLEQGYAAHLPPADLPQSGWTERGYETLRRDRCYPPMGMLPLKLFPQSWTGAGAWAVTGCGLFLLALCVLSRSPWPLAFACSAPFLFTFERANTICLVAVAVAVFLFWWNSEVKWKRIVAAVALGFAAAMKVTPAALGVLYLGAEPFARRGGWKMLLLAAGVTVGLFFLPFAVMPEGFDGIRFWVENAAANGQYYAERSAFGLGSLARTVLIACGRRWEGVTSLAILQHVGQVFGLVCLLVGGRRRDLLLVVGGLLFASGNMMFYGFLYLLPVWTLELVANPPKRRFGWFRFEPVLWWMMACPLQLAIARNESWFSANVPLANVLLMADLVWRLSLVETENETTKNTKFTKED